MKRTTRDWFDSAQSDLLLIREILDNEFLTHLAAFHAQQAIEKSFKAILEEFEIGLLKTHSLETLYGIIRKKIKLEIDIDLLIILDQLYIDSRYPGELGLLPNGKPSTGQAREFYSASCEILEIAKQVTGG